MAFARGNLCCSRDFKLSQKIVPYYLTVFSGLFSEFLVKREILILTSNSSTDPPVSLSKGPVQCPLFVFYCYFFWSISYLFFCSTSYLEQFFLLYGRLARARRSVHPSLSKGLVSVSKSKRFFKKK